MGWGKRIQGVEEIHWQDDKSFSSETEADLPEEEECQGQEIKDRLWAKLLLWSSSYYYVWAENVCRGNGCYVEKKTRKTSRNTFGWTH